MAPSKETIEFSWDVLVRSGYIQTLSLGANGHREQYINSWGRVPDEAGFIVANPAGGVAAGRRMHNGVWVLMNLARDRSLSSEEGRIVANDMTLRCASEVYERGAERFLMFHDKGRPNTRRLFEDHLESPECEVRDEVVDVYRTSFSGLGGGQQKNLYSGTTLMVGAGARALCNFDLPGLNPFGLLDACWLQDPLFDEGADADLLHDVCDFYRDLGRGSATIITSRPQPAELFDSFGLVRAFVGRRWWGNRKALAKWIKHLESLR